jgi:predicted metal-dependent phosphoesterase TrpH
MSIDLHAHTTASDGSLSPSELVSLAREIGLSALGITDHDTIGGWNEAFEAGARRGIEIVPGVELSVSYEGGRFHLLGYYIDPDSALIQTLGRIQAARADRNGEILDNLRALGLPLEEAFVRSFSGSPDGQLGRPHFAQAMVARGYVSSTQEAFDLYLADGKPAYATKAVLTPRDAIEGIRAAGGVSVWAHPPLNRHFSLDELGQKARQWRAWGLDGLETFYSKYTPRENAWARAVCSELDLIESGGSDFHGRSKPTVFLGQSFANQSVPDQVLQKLKARRDTVREQELM